MQKVLVDQFVFPGGLQVQPAPGPERSKVSAGFVNTNPETRAARFLEEATKVQEFLKGLPGFVEGFLYEKKGGEGSYNYFTTAVWENAEAFENAKKAVAAEYKRQGYDPEKVRIELRIERERSVYERSPY